MSTPPPAITDQDIADLCRDAAEALADAVGLYRGLIHNLAELVSTKPVGAEQRLKATRRAIAPLCAHLALVCRFIDELLGHYSAELAAERDPRTIQPLLRVINESMLVILGMSTLAQLEQAPLFHLQLLERHLRRPEVVALLELSDVSLPS